MRTPQLKVLPEPDQERELKETGINCIVFDGRRDDAKVLIEADCGGIPC